MSSHHFPQLIKNNLQITSLLSTIAPKFDQARKTFIDSTYSKLEQENAKLEKAINVLKTMLVSAEVAAGIPQISILSNNSDHSFLSNRENFSLQKNSPIPSLGKKKEEKSGEKKKVELGERSALVDDVIDIGRLDLRVGRIIKCEKHPDADALYVEQIDVGEDSPRTVVSGLVRHVPIHQMQNRLVVVICNLKPAKMRGVESRAMVLCASTPEKVEIMEVDESSIPGTSVVCPPFTHRPDVQLNPKKKIWETVSENLTVCQDGYGTWKGNKLLVGGQTLITAPSLREVFIK